MMGDRRWKREEGRPETEDGLDNFHENAQRIRKI